ncbi:PREDICTED: zinc finger protein ZPR1 [Rhagoletis zephyria]|uniref:zinc finger protein ZPR1 n=1 Tax=Rhagoletis zephyria TaxID=28612 RepID=UPI000811643D|nr:PREDICTED: zinc finger protein ZPR1 [Rhagoletis zephyria]
MSTENVMETAGEKKPLFRNIDADDPDPETTELESACMNCFRSGRTRLLLTKIPFFKEVVIMSFKCEDCGYENNEIQSASEIQKKGVRIELSVKCAEDLNRKVVRSDYTSVRIPEVELEIPSQSQKGEITTVEGIIDRTIRGLTQDQESRKREHPDDATAIDAYIEKLTALKELQNNFTLILEDISGNSFVENPRAPSSDPNCKIHYFQRLKEQDHILGLYSPKTVASIDEDGKKEPRKDQENQLLKPIAEDAWGIDDLHGEVLQFQTLCSQCGSSCETNMKLTKIPHFKEVVIMATVCEECGCKTNEVKSGSGIEELGIRFEIRVEDKEDLTRDVLKSETCCLKIPELECEVGPSALGGRFTTIEGILMAMKDQLQNEGCLFHDSADDEIKKRLEGVIDRFDEILALNLKATLVLDDPAGNSYVQSLADGDELDSKLKIERYERSFDQNEELGLNDMKTENYVE